ncbi:MAG: hypothetical protein J6P62_08480 [Bacteroidales bacterium]|nr:hypothetical protein [Bacteroidales bacterium]
MKRLVLILSAALLLAQGQASAQFPGMPRVNRDSLNALTNADHAQMLGQLGLTSVRTPSLLHFQRYLGCGQMAGSHRHVHGHCQSHTGV